MRATNSSSSSSSHTKRSRSIRVGLLLGCYWWLCSSSSTTTTTTTAAAAAWVATTTTATKTPHTRNINGWSFGRTTRRYTTTTTTTSTTTNNNNTNEQNDSQLSYTIPDEAVVTIKPAAMRRLRELRKDDNSTAVAMILRMGVRSGGCSGMSYVMDFCTVTDIQPDDVVDVYPDDNIQCVVDAKSMLYLYGLELDYSTELIGGGFKFYNPNAEESCGCGSSFGV
jgi:iron-sulfur cluster assembly 1